MSATSPRRSHPPRIVVAVAMFGAALAVLPAPARSGEPPVRPNFVVILSDDQPWDTTEGSVFVDGIAVVA